MYGQIARLEIIRRASADLISLRDICLNLLIHASAARTLICIDYHLGDAR